MPCEANREYNYLDGQVVTSQWKVSLLHVSMAFDVGLHLLESGIQVSAHTG